MLATVLFLIALSQRFRVQAAFATASSRSRAD